MVIEEYAGSGTIEQVSFLITEAYDCSGVVAARRSLD